MPAFKSEEKLPLVTMNQNNNFHGKYDVVCMSQMLNHTENTPADKDVGSYVTLQRFTNELKQNLIVIVGHVMTLNFLLSGNGQRLLL